MPQRTASGGSHSRCSNNRDSSDRSSHTSEDAPAAAASAAEGIANEILSQLEAGPFDDAAFDVRLLQLTAAAVSESQLPLARPERLFGRLVALMAASSPRETAASASAVLAALLADDASERRKQAAAAAGTVVPALIRDCTREGRTRAHWALWMIIYAAPNLADFSRRLGALQLLLRRLATLPPGGGGGGGSGGADEGVAEDIVHTMAAAATICRMTAHSPDELVALAEAPGVLEHIARGLERRGGDDGGNGSGGANSTALRMAAARLMEALINRYEGDRAAEVVLDYPGVMQGAAGLIADAAAFGPAEYANMVVAADAALEWRAAEAAALMARTPGFFAGLEHMLTTGVARPGPSPAQAFAPAGFSAARKFGGATQNLAALVAALARAPTRAFLAARARLVAALDARIAVAEEWKAAADAVEVAPDDGGPPWLPPHFFEMVLGITRDFRAKAMRATEADLVDGDAGPPAAPAAAAPAAAVAAAPAGKAARRCLACGREDGSGGGDGGAGGGVALQQCAGCKGTGLKAFFCDRACLKAGWKAHKPDCEAARLRRQEQQGAAAGGSGSGSGSGSGEPQRRVWVM